ncbi:unnamed protein product [Cuscuta campestris]|uniref:Pentacotripeptide-repeat region of PRORP domain-containing protein n=1 Tax=Cuscuta campestris TaxID=132261 RepID=A0A484NC74_9ASTE|nr:unnamed protein product [Cuscuta campestris]
MFFIALYHRLQHLQPQLRVSTNALIHGIFLTHRNLTSFHTQNDPYPNPTSPSSPSECTSIVQRVCSLVCESYSNRENTHSPKLRLPVDIEKLTPEQCITVVASLADEAGSMAALGFFHRAIECPKFRNFMRLYIVSSMCLMRNENFERAHEVLHCMVKNFGEIGMLKEAVDMVFEMCNQGLVFTPRTLNCIVIVAGRGGRIEIAEKVFEEMCERGLCPDALCFKSMVVAYCRLGRAVDADRWMSAMLEKGFIVDNATCTLIMVSLIHGLCTKGWTEKAFRLFLKLVRSDTYKPNVHTYTVMITGYCKEEKLSRAEMLLNRMQEQGLAPNAQTYTSLIDGYCKAGNFTRAYELMGVIKNNGLSLGMATYNSVIDGLFKKGEVREAYKLLDEGVRAGLSADLVTYTILISDCCRRNDTQCKQKRMKESEKLFDDAIRLDLVPTKETLTSMISGYCRDKNITSAMKFFHRMGEYGCAPDSLAYGALISGLCKESMLDEARNQYHSMMDKGITPCEVTRLTIAYEFCKKDDPSTAMVLLDGLDKKLWTHEGRAEKLEVENAQLKAELERERSDQAVHATTWAAQKPKKFAKTEEVCCQEVGIRFFQVSQQLIDDIGIFGFGTSQYQKHRGLYGILSNRLQDFDPVVRTHNLFGHDRAVSTRSNTSHHFFYPSRK